MKRVFNAFKILGSIALSYFVLVAPALADQGAQSGDDKSWIKMLIAGGTIAVASVGGTLGQSKTACVALEAIGRNPSAQNKIFVPLVVSLALLESLVIYALVVVFAKM